MTFSKKAIYSLKLALAITLAYSVGLSMNWEQPRWAAITITLMALSTVGQSLNDAVERIFGTALAGFMAITFLALFSQDRWLYMFSLSAWIAFCTYLAAGGKYKNFWMLAGFASAIVATDAGIDPVNAFEDTILRLEQTYLGLLSFTLVFVFLWPDDGYADFKAVSCKLTSAQQKLYELYRDLMNGQLGDAEKNQSAHLLRMQVLQSSGNLLPHAGIT